MLLEEIDIDDNEGDIKKDVATLTESGLVNTQLAEKLLLKGSKLRRLSTALPLYTDTASELPTPQRVANKKVSPFLSIEHNGHTMYIRKSTAVWLFNEGERVSSDRLFRVRDTQPFTTTDLVALRTHHQLNAAEYINIGDICIK